MFKIDRTRYSPVIAQSKNINFVMGGNARYLGGTGGKVGPKLEKLIFPGNQGQLLQFCPGRLEDLILHILDPNYSSFYLECPRKYQKTYNIDIFSHFPKFVPLPPQNFKKTINLIIPAMCILLKFDSAKSGVSNISLPKLSKKNLWGGGGVGSTPLGTGRVICLHYH